LYNWNTSDCDFQYIYITNILRVADLSNITEKQIKGIKLCIKGVSKSFPFVKGFIFDKDNVTYQHAWFLYILIDTEEVGRFYDTPVTSSHYKTAKVPYSTFGIPFDWGKQVPLSGTMHFKCGILGKTPWLTCLIRPTTFFLNLISTRRTPQV